MQEYQNGTLTGIQVGQNHMKVTGYLSIRVVLPAHFA